MLGHANYAVDLNAHWVRHVCILAPKLTAWASLISTLATRLSSGTSALGRHIFVVSAPSGVLHELVPTFVIFDEPRKGGARTVLQIDPGLAEVFTLDYGCVPDVGSFILRCVCSQFMYAITAGFIWHADR